MAENDIYKSKEKYERYKARLEEFALLPGMRSGRKSWTAVYYCLNRANLKHFRRLFAVLETRDLSYIRRCRIVETVRFITGSTEKDLRDCEREDIDQIVAKMHSTFKSPHSKQDFIKTLKYVWRALFAELDERGRVDETITPYVVRHLSAGVDKSRGKARKDKLTWEEFRSLVTFFDDDPMMQCYLTMHLECLARPQELCYLKLSDCQLEDEYAVVQVSEHGKEGPKRLLVVDSYPYFLKWFDVHRLKAKDGYLFVNERGRQLTPNTANKKIKQARNQLGIDKPITNYSLKRSGVTLRRLRGDSDSTIQHIAGWTSTKQLKTYDLTAQDDVFKQELVKRGIIEEAGKTTVENKKCEFCGTVNGFSQTICVTCRRILDRRKVGRELSPEHAQPSMQVLENPEMGELFKLMWKLERLIGSADRKGAEACIQEELESRRKKLVEGRKLFKEGEYV